MRKSEAVLIILAAIPAIPIVVGWLSPIKSLNIWGIQRELTIGFGMTVIAVLLLYVVFLITWILLRRRSRENDTLTLRINAIFRDESGYGEIWATDGADFELDGNALVTFMLDIIQPLHANGVGFEVSYAPESSIMTVTGPHGTVEMSYDTKHDITRVKARGDGAHLRGETR